MVVAHNHTHVHSVKPLMMMMELSPPYKSQCVIKYIACSEACIQIYSCVACQLHLLSDRALNAP